MLGAIIGFALVCFFAVLLLMTAFGLMAWLNKPEGLRPPWWDWGMDKPAETTQKPAIDTKVEAAAEVVKTKVATRPQPKW